MKFSSTTLLSLFAFCAWTQGAAIPENDHSLSLRSPPCDFLDLEPASAHHLSKRKGGGGRGGGSSSSGSSGRGSGSSSSSSGSSSSGRTSSSSNTGGRSSTGSGVTPSYGGGKYYAGGAATPYTSGLRSPGGITPYYLGAGGLGFAGVYAYGAYLYPYPHPYIFHNQSAAGNESMTNSSIPVQCLCQRYQECGCDDNTDDSYLASIVGNGSASDMNATVARVADVNGTSTLLIDGTLANGTTAAGGTASSAARGLSFVEGGGWWVLVVGVSGAVWLM